MRGLVEYGTRSRRQAVNWNCSQCGTLNKTVRKLVFDVPVWSCTNTSCNRKFVQENHQLDFCLADIEVNGMKLIQKVFRQRVNACIDNAMCQCIQITYMLQCIVGNKRPTKKMLNLEPNLLYKWFEKTYSKMSITSGNDTLSHALIKRALKLRNEGMPFCDGSTPYRVGDVTTIDKNNYEAICDELADGQPLFAIVLPGSGFENLEYCLIYFPPNEQDAVRCDSANQHEEQHQPHFSHAVVLLGAASNGKQRGFYFINSWGLWAPRFVVDPSNNSQTTEYGVAKYLDTGLICNVLKFWPQGEDGMSTGWSLTDEKGAALKYSNLPLNEKLLGA